MVTNIMKLKGRNYQTVMQVHPVRYVKSNGVNTVRCLLSNGVKVLSPENDNILKDDLMRKREVGTIITAKEGEVMIALTGSESTVW